MLNKIPADLRCSQNSYLLLTKICDYLAGYRSFYSVWHNPHFFIETIITIILAIERFLKISLIIVNLVLRVTPTYRELVLLVIQVGAGIKFPSRVSGTTVVKPALIVERLAVRTEILLCDNLFQSVVKIALELYIRLCKILVDVFGCYFL